MTHLDSDRHGSQTIDSPPDQPDFSAAPNGGAATLDFHDRAASDEPRIRRPIISFFDRSAGPWRRYLCAAPPVSELAEWLGLLRASCRSDLHRDTVCRSMDCEPTLTIPVERRWRSQHDPPYALLSVSYRSPFRASIAGETRWYSVQATFVSASTKKNSPHITDSSTPRFLAVW